MKTPILLLSLAFPFFFFGLPANAQEAAADPAEGLIATLEIRGINNVMRQAGSVMQMMGQEMELEDMQAMFGAMVMTQDGIDLDGTMRVFIPDTEINPMAMEEPPIVFAFPTKGDGFLKSLALSMNKKDGAKNDEAHFSPKPGGAAQFGGMPSLSSMPFHTKKVGDTVFLGPDLKKVRAVVPLVAKLAKRKNVPGTIALDLNVDKVVDAAEVGMKQMAEQQKEMMAGFIEQQEEMIEQFKKDGQDTTDLEENLKQMKKAQGGPMAQMKPVFDLLRQVEVLQFGIEAKNKMFTAYTLAEPKSGSMLGKSVAGMKPPSEAFRRAVPENAVMAYVGRVAHLDDMVKGYMGWMGQIMNMAAAEDPEEAKQIEPIMKLMEEAIGIFDGQFEGEIMSAILPGAGMRQIGAIAAKDAPKLEKDILDFYTQLGDVEWPEESGVKEMDWQKGKKRKHNGRDVTSFKLDIDMEEPEFGGPNPLAAMKDMTIEVGQDGKHLLYAVGEESYNKLADGLAGKSSALPFEQRGAFAKNFPKLPKTPVSMYSYDILGYIHMMMAMMDPEDAEDFPKQGAVLTGWSNKLGSKYLHIDRIRFEDVTKAIQAGQMMFMRQMQNMQEGFEVEGFEDEF